MKKSILIIGTLVLSILNMSALNKNIIESTSTKITKTHIAQIFDWEVKTNKGTYAGTALSLKSAKQMIMLSSAGEIIKDKKITSYLVLKNDTNRNYFWEVKTATGYAKGYSSSEAYAHKIMNLVSSGDTIISKIIISQIQQ